MEENKITDTFALDMLIKLSAAEIKRSALEQHNRDAALNALRRFALVFLPEDEITLKPQGDGCELTAYEAAYIIVKSTTDSELKALWYIFYPYLVAASPHLDDELYEKTRDELTRTDVLEAVLASRYRSLVNDCREDLEAAGLAGMYVEWYEPYSKFREEILDSGDTREMEMFKKLLAGGDFPAVADGTEKLLDRDPYNCDIALLNIAARVSILGRDPVSRENELKEVVTLIDEFLAQNLDERKQAYLHYYRGLCLLGLTAGGSVELDDAKAEFDVCIEITPDFELAKFMLNAIEAKLENLN
ncbi:MAG: hypothetical protein HFK09_05375 [Clostridia bacterium]|nr:hypothetical protein [Clostridia bacterium]